MREVKNARAVAGVVRTSPCEEVFFCNFQLLRKREDSGEETRPERSAYFLFLSEPMR